MRDTVAIMDLWPPESECFVCGARLFGTTFGVPTYEGEVLPNDWPGEWGGFPACETCFDWQQTLTEPRDPKECPNAG